MAKKNKIQKNTYGIIGLGRFGYSLALELALSGAEIMVLDADETKVREIREYTENAFIVKNLDKKTLEETGVNNCDIVIVCIGSAVDTSILTTLNLVSLGVKKVYAKCSSEEHGEILEKLGAEVVYPERDIAIRLARRLEASKVLDYVQLSEKLNISKLAVPQTMVGKSVLEVNFRANYGVNIIAVENGTNVIDSVGPKYTFREGDILYVSGSKENLEKLSQAQ